MSYSIWIVPPEPVFSQLQECIKKLSAEYAGPVFEPHLTVLAQIEGDLIEIEQKTKELAAQLQPFELSFGPVSYSTTYYQNVLLTVNPSAQLTQLHLEAQKLLGMSKDVFMPHMSLLYGNHDAAMRERITASVKISPPSFVVESLVITPAVSDPQGWKHVATISL